jgi:hypothetical protein
MNITLHSKKASSFVSISFIKEGYLSRNYVYHPTQALNAATAKERREKLKRKEKGKRYPRRSALTTNAILDP